MVSRWTYITLTMLLCVELGESRTFRAAVLEHALHLPNRTFVVSRQQALAYVEPNLAEFERQAAIARTQNVDILVTPEDGIYGMGYKRTTLRPYLETIPDPKQVTWNPCTASADIPNVDVQRRLSCLARDNALYLVANYGDIQPCSVRNDSNCPSDGHYQHNTNIVFDPNGTLIARYHKKHLFFEYQFDEPSEAKNIVFETPFGKFGVFTCFDIMFEKPAVSLIDDLGVGNIVFPTAWMDALPFLAAVEFHSAFAMGMGVNFLAANIHRPEYRFHGSGIYTPDGAAVYYYNDTVGSGGGKLLIADIEVLDKPTRRLANDQTKPDSRMLSVDQFEFKSYAFNDLFNFVSLRDSHADEIKVCHNALCCHAKYTANIHEGDRYALGAFDGLHTYEGQYYLQICTMLKCANSSYSSCGSPTLDARSIFSNINIWGTFNTPYLFPEVLMSDSGSLALAQTQLSFKNGTLDTKNPLDLSLLSATVFGRKYSWDDGNVYYMPSGSYSHDSCLLALLLCLLCLL
ncbi:pantetheinase-like [Haliotis rubra]|uniref:pantetheinase-like n=1 Tax=Haliotis rubra TaxID=36100 RepID=UPI001EE5E530|nr:pantetheinase-like [Haliotis rubra]